MLLAALTLGEDMSLSVAEGGVARYLVNITGARGDA